MGQPQALPATRCIPSATACMEGTWVQFLFSTLVCKAVRNVSHKQNPTYFESAPFQSTNMLLLITIPSSYLLAYAAVLSYVLIGSFFSVANKFVVIYCSINKARYVRNDLSI